jgi:hypothetical protein
MPAAATADRRPAAAPLTDRASHEPAAVAAGRQPQPNQQHRRSGEAGRIDPERRRHLQGWRLAATLAWEAVVYGTAEGLLLLVLAVLVTWQAFAAHG